jgi:GxxExxY protein
MLSTDDPDFTDFRKKMMKRDPQTYAIIGAGMEVHKHLGPGFLEAVYHEALAIELTARDIPFQHEADLIIRYKDYQLSACYRADFICFDDIIVEIKAIKQLSGTEESQIINYLKASGFKRGLLLNFGSPSLKYKRFVY